LTELPGGVGRTGGSHRCRRRDTRARRQEQRVQHVCMRMRLSMLSMVRGRSRRSGPRAASWGGHTQYEASGCMQTSGVSVRRLHLLHSPLDWYQAWRRPNEEFPAQSLCPRLPKVGVKLVWQDSWRPGPLRQCALELATGLSADAGCVWVCRGCGRCRAAAVRSELPRACPVHPDHAS